jgi:hypothetical protein
VTRVDVGVRAYARGMEGEGERPGMQERDDDLVALEGLEAELADLDDALSQVDRSTDEPAEPPTGS